MSHERTGSVNLPDAWIADTMPHVRDLSKQGGVKTLLLGGERGRHFGGLGGSSRHLIDPHAHGAAGAGQPLLFQDDLLSRNIAPS